MLGSFCRLIFCRIDTTTFDQAGRESRDQVLEQQSHINPARQRFVGVATILSVVLCAVLIELARRMELAVPVPFLILYGAVAFAAGFSGLRVALISASIVASFVIHSSMVGYGPASLTAGPFQVSCGILIGFAIAVLIGRRRDQLVYLAKTLEDKQIELMAARDELAVRAEKKSHQLDNATAELVNAEMLLENTVLYSPFAVVVISDQFNINSVNPAGLEIFGLETLPSDWRFLGTFLRNIRFFMEDNREIEFGTGPIYNALRNATITDDFVCRIVRTDKTERWLRGCFAPVRASDGSICGATAIFVDISEQKYAERRLKDFISRVLKTHEDERSVIAYRLQDDIAQHLVATKMNLHSAALTGNYTDPVRDTIGRIDTLMDSVRDWSLELRPAALDDLGLESALRWYLTTQQKHCDYDIVFEVNIADDKLSSEIGIACFRIVQQAVTNALDHANAQALTITMYSENDRLCLDIVDDGCGFDVDKAILGPSGGGGLGLITMRERAIVAGGEFKVISALGQGTTVSVCFPGK